MSASPRLTHLLELAAQGPAMRVALAEETVELLAAWPDDCPAEMRPPCEALLAHAARDVDDVTKSRLRVRLFADPQLVARTLPREMPPVLPDERVQNQAGSAPEILAERPRENLVAMARRGGDLRPALAEALHLDAARRDEILADETGRALAIACKALDQGRAIFSALVLLAAPADAIEASYARLEIFDQVTDADAAEHFKIH